MKYDKLKICIGYQLFIIKLHLDGKVTKIWQFQFDDTNSDFEIIKAC